MAPPTSPLGPHGPLDLMPDRVAVLIRHGRYRQQPDTPSAHQPHPLTPEGREDAARGAALVESMARSHGWAIHHALHASTLLRAWQTAEIIASAIDAVDTIDGTDALAERSVGQAANLSLAQIERIVDEDPRHGPLPPDWKSRSDFRLPLLGAESLLESGERVAACLRAVMDSVQPDPVRGTMVLFVGHGAAFRHAAHHLGVLTLERVAELSMHHAVPVALAVAPDGAWTHVAGEWKRRRRRDAERDW